MPTYLWENKETGEIVEVVNRIADMDNPPDLEGEWVRTMQAPLVAKILIPSGFGIRESDSAWQAGKEAAALDDSTLDMPVHSKERQEIKAEAKRIRSSIKK